MNELLDENWREGKPPFSGHVLVVDGELSPDDLVVTLGEAVSALRAAYTACELRVNEDWHDHDGFINSDKTCTWDELESWTTSVASIKASCSDEWMVHTLVFSTSLDFCLRYWFEQDLGGSGEATCRFDLSADDRTLRRIADALLARGLQVSTAQVARDYFEKRESE
ncbi:MAG: hypothetical protein IPK83_19580 [Planctomycetes bacterium]|nr:hypothetical protein [Planctomycetota bacterium]